MNYLTTLLLFFVVAVQAQEKQIPVNGSKIKFAESVDSPFVFFDVIIFTKQMKLFPGG